MRNLSTDVINNDFQTTIYKKWKTALDIKTNARHAKYWEQMMLCEALERSGMLSEGKHGLGFGVGREQLVSLFASHGVHTTATDQAPDNKSLAWDNGQLANGKESLFYKNIVSKDVFDKNVTFRHYDMNKYEGSFLGKFDFCWSNCVIGHLGSMEKSENFLKRHAKYIKDGGISVLTTELNISSLATTVEKDSGTIIWRLSDLYRLFNTLLDEGLVANRFKLRLQRDASDKYIYFDIDSVDPFNMEKIGDKPMTKIPFSNYAITPIQIMFKKRKISNLQKKVLRKLYNNDLRQNTKKLKKYINSTGDISDYATTYNDTDLVLTPKTATKRLSGKAGSVKEVSIEYTNKTDKPFFSYGLHTPLGIPPLVLSTANPTNRTSKVRTKKWFSPNRPSVSFRPIYHQASFIDHCHGYHRVLPGESFVYSFDIKLPTNPGKYSEDFILVLEGMGDAPHSKVTLTLNVI